MADRKSAGWANPSRVERKKWGANGHRYQLDGQWVQGVTTILNTMAKPALIDWAAREVTEYANENWGWLSTLTRGERTALMSGAHNRVRDAAGARGTMLHDVVVPLLRGEPVAQLPLDADPDVYDLASNAVRFMDDWGIHPILIETVVFNDEPRYAGTLDLVATAERYPGRTFLIDWKTNRKGIWPEVALQLSAYANADYYVDSTGHDQRMADLGITDNLALALSPEGYEVRPTANGPEVYEFFALVAGVSARSNTKAMQALLLEPLELEVAS
jgi:hypothetical protein